MSETVQASELTVGVFVTPPTLTVTVRPSAAPEVVPATVTELSSSVALILSSVAIVLIETVGAVLSIVYDSPLNGRVEDGVGLIPVEFAKLS